MNIELKEQPKYILNFHSNTISCSTVLKDGRFVTGSGDKSIIIYNKETFKPDLMINEHNNIVNNIIELNSGKLASCSSDNTIKIFKIIRNEYKVIQTLTEHKDRVNKIIQLKNNKLVSCSNDKSIIIYNKINNEYKKEYSFTTIGKNGPIIQTKDNEICYSDYENNERIILFFDFNEKKLNNKIINFNITRSMFDSLLMISKDLLLITGYNKISIVNINSYNLMREISVSDSGNIYTACMLNKNIILTGDENKRIIQWKIEDDNLKLISKKENAHNNKILTLSKIENGLILSGSGDELVKIW